jgi:hypothetical protein
MEQRTCSNAVHLRDPGLASRIFLHDIAQPASVRNKSKTAALLGSVLQRYGTIIEVKRTMRKILMAMLALFAGFAFTPLDETVAGMAEENFDAMQSMVMFEKTGLGKLGLSMHAFYLALGGYGKLLNEGKLGNPRYLSIVDFSQPSNNRRLYIIDMKDTCLSFHTWVSHGRNSGEKYATKFSNVQNSLMSSLGFFVTGNTYMGQHGLSLRLKGQEPGINDKAEQRGIVMHAADYVSQTVAQRQGFIGRSWGCPAVPTELNEPIIETIKEGSAFFIYHPGTQYQKYSRYARVK